MIVAGCVISCLEKKRKTRKGKQKERPYASVILDVEKQVVIIAKNKD